MNKNAFNNIILFGTEFGIKQSLQFFPKESILALVAPSNRPSQVNAVKEIALENKIKYIEQPSKKQSAYFEFSNEIKVLQPDLIWSNAHSMLIPDDILSIVNYNAINIHWSLLPKNQGPNPVQWSIIKGERKTGVTFHMMDTKFDCGDIIYQEEIVIDKEDTWVSLFNKLEKLSFEMQMENISSILSNKFVRKKQNKDDATINRRLNIDSPHIDFTKLNDDEIYDLIRAQVSPLKGAYIKTGSGQKEYFNRVVSMNEIANLRIKYAS